ncbi:hypothetical protein LTR66_010812 [Elasticomyces elasticus]|nr:hypothetical protein LTR66_010812 [Elasticomyces elasticus]
MSTVTPLSLETDISTTDVAKSFQPDEHHVTGAAEEKQSDLRTPEQEGEHGRSSDHSSAKAVTPETRGLENAAKVEVGVMDSDDEPPATLPVMSRDSRRLEGLSLEEQIQNESYVQNKAVTQNLAKQITDLSLNARLGMTGNQGVQQPHQESSPTRPHDTSASPPREDVDTPDDSKSEIQSIMDQFEDGMGGQGMEEIMSPRLGRAQPVFPPPRKSSLEPMRSHNSVSSLRSLDKTISTETYEAQPLSQAKPPSISGSSLHKVSSYSAASVLSPQSTGTSITQPPLPEPDPEPALPFDFHRFLEQLRHRTADPCARFLRSFLLEFGRKQWMVHEQVKIISDFLEFISKKMSLCEVWRNVSDAEFENAREGMEKLVMNRLYTQTFSPAIPPLEPPAGARNKKRAPQSPQRQGRRGQHREDVERDEVIAQKVRIYGWVSETHLDIQPLNASGQKFSLLAQQELLKMNSYRAPRDKVICVLNACKVIFGYLKNSHSDQSADAFVPLLIYTVLRANPEHLFSNVQYILRFRNQDKLGGEAGYYVSSLMGVVQFIENLDRTNLTISDEEFERNVEVAVSQIAEGHKAEEPEQQARVSDSTPPAQLYFPEKSTLSRPEVTPRNSMEVERANPRRTVSQRQRNEKTASDESEENAAVAGLLRTIQKPLSTIGRIFSDESTSSASRDATNRGHYPATTPRPGSTPSLSPAPRLERRRSNDDDKLPQRRPGRDRDRERERGREAQHLSAEDAAARQASAESAEAQKIHRQEHKVIVETLQGMFPDLDRDVISDVVRMKEGRVGLAVDACLALSN